MTQFKLVPVEPTREMCAAAVNLAGQDGDHHEMLGRSYFAYKAMLAAAPSPWVSVGERLPEPEVDVLVFCADGYKGGIVTAGLFEGYGDIKVEGRNGGYGWASWETEKEVSGIVVTHWMPLPPPPATQEGDE